MTGNVLLMIVAAVVAVMTVGVFLFLVVYGALTRQTIIPLEVFLSLLGPVIGFLFGSQITRQTTNGTIQQLVNALQQSNPSNKGNP